MLVFASGALVLRALLIRRRFRRNLQDAIDAGILPPPPSLQNKPELYDVCIRAAGDAMDWGNLLVGVHLWVYLRWTDALCPFVAHLCHELGSVTASRLKMPITCSRSCATSSFGGKTRLGNIRPPFSLDLNDWAARSISRF